MRRTSTDRAKAALGYIVAGLKQEKGTYRFLHYDESGGQAAIEAPDGARFVVMVLEEQRS